MKKQFISKPDKCKITYYAWEVRNPKAIIHIVHGAIEYALGYKDFAKMLNENGYSVFAMDVRGHGETGKRTSFGYFGDEKGYQLVWNDVHRINTIIKKKYPDKKIVLFGHSMGSFISRSYVTQYHDVDMLIGIGSAQKARIETQLTKFLITFNLNKKNRGEPGRLYYRILALKLSKPFKSENDPLSWIASDRKYRDLFTKSEYTGFMMTNSGFYDMAMWMDVLTNPYHIKNISNKLPILLLNGIDDPVSGMGRETIKAEKIYKKFHLDCTLIQYKGMRHQILHENGKNKVENDILTFIQKHL